MLQQYHKFLPNRAREMRQTDLALFVSVFYILYVSIRDLSLSPSLSLSFYLSFSLYLPVCLSRSVQTDRTRQTDR